MGITIQVTEFSVLEAKIKFRFTFSGSTVSATDNIYIDVKNTNDSESFANFMDTTVDFNDIVALNLIVTKMGRMFNGTSKTFRVRWKGYSATTTITLPMSYTPTPYVISERPTQQTQHVQYNNVNVGQAGCCVACATASSIETLKMRTGKTVYQYSVGWIYGCGGGNSDVNEGMNVAKTLEILKTIGSPPHQVLTNTVGQNSYPDIFYKTDAVKLYDDNYSSAINYATPQRLASWKRINDDDGNWNYESIFNAIQRSNSVVVMNLYVNQAFDDAIDTGWVGGMQDSIRGGHAMIVLGWVINGGKYYWVCQNSWASTNGEPYGDNGIFYVPFDHFSYNWTGIKNFYELVRDDNAPEMPTIPDRTGMPSLVSRTPDGFNLKCNQISGASSYEFRYRKDGSSTYNSITSSTNTISITGLDNGYTYYLSVRFYKNGIWSNYSNESQCTVVPDYPAIEKVYSTTQNNLIVKLKNNMMGKFSYIDIWRRNYPWSDSDSNLDSKIIYSVDTLAEWTGLTTGSKYSFSARTRLEVNGTILSSYYRSFEVDGIVGNSGRPPLFSWDSPKISGQSINVTADEWNKLLDNINLVLVYKGKSRVAFTKASKGMPISASIFNEARSTIRVMLGTTVDIPLAVTNITTISANHFNKLAEAINAIT